MLDKIFSKLARFVPEKWRWVLNHDGFKRYFANTGWMFFGQMFSLLVSFFIGAWLARYLGPENYGIMSYAIAFVGLFSFIANLGVDAILSRELVKFPDKRDELLGTIFRLKLIGGFTACFITVVFSFLIKSDSITRVLIILFSTSLILQAINVISTYFQAEVKSKNNVKALLIATIVSSILKVVFILLGKGVIWIIIIYILEFVWQGLGFVNAYNHYGLKIKNWKFNKKLAKSILNNSWPLILSSAVWFIYLRIDQVMIGLFLGNREVGIYSAAVRIVEIWYFIPGIICSSLFPAIINAKKISKNLYKHRLKNLYILMILIPVIIGIPVSVLAKPIIYILFGGGYLESVSILRIYIWSSLGLFLVSAITQYLMSENLIKTIFYLNFIIMAINVALNLLLIPLIGLPGAAWATLISYLTGPVIISIINNKIINLNKI